jgi:sporulation-control protein spo0M
MRKFKCEECAGFCELTIFAEDFEDQLPEWCPSCKALRCKWEEVQIVLDDGEDHCNKALEYIRDISGRGF